jgi:hypothetical protein
MKDYIYIVLLDPMTPWIVLFGILYYPDFTTETHKQKDGVNQIANTTISGVIELKDLF